MLESGTFSIGDLFTADLTIQRRYEARVDFTTRIVCGSEETGQAIFTINTFNNLQRTPDESPVTVPDFPLGRVPDELNDLIPPGAAVPCRIESTGGYRLQLLPFMTKLEQQTLYSDWFEVTH